MIADILWIDEDTSLTDGMITLLELEGFKVRKEQTATTAYEHIRTSGIGKFALLIIDVMLTPGTNEALFGREITKDYVITGLILARKLKEDYGVDATKRMFLYTRASWPWVLDDVKRVAGELGIEWARRNSRMTPDVFLAQVKNIVKRNFGDK